MSGFSVFYKYQVLMKTAMKACLAFYHLLSVLDKNTLACWSDVFPFLK